MSEPTTQNAPIARFQRRTDFVNADRGFIGTLEPMVIRTADGRVIWDMDSWGFLDADARTPSTRAYGGRRSSPPSTVCMR